MALTEEEKRRIDEEEEYRAVARARAEIHARENHAPVIPGEAQGQSDQPKIVLITPDRTNTSARDPIPPPFHDSAVRWCLIIALVLVRVSDLVVVSLLEDGKGAENWGQGLVIWLIVMFGLVRGKTWARGWVIFWLAVASIYHLYRFSVFEDYFTLAYGLSLVALQAPFVFFKISRRKAYLFLATQVLIMGALVSLVSIRGSQLAEIKRSLAQPNSPLVQFGKERLYELRLPGPSWGFITRESFKTASGADFPDGDLYFATKTLKVLGFSIPETLESMNIDDPTKEEIERVKDSFKTTLKSDGKLRVEREKDVANGFDLELAAGVGKETYYYIRSFRVLGKLAISFFFMTDQAHRQQLLQQYALIVNATSETPAKVRLSTLSAKEVFDKFSDAVVLIRNYSTAGDLLAFGSGVNVVDTGFVLTNCHVVFAGGDFLDVKFPKNGTFDDVGISGMAYEEDVCLLKFLGKGLPTVPLNFEVPTEVGDKVFVIGSPKGLVNTISQGIVSGIRPGPKNHALYQMTAPISAGSSGGPVINEYGFVIGVSTLINEQGQNLNFAVSTQNVPGLKNFDSPIALKEFMDYLRKRDEQRVTKKP